MASLYPKKIGGKTYWYLREMARVDGKPKMVSERYLGTAAEIAAAVEGREAAALPERTRHLAFGDVAAAWGMLDEIGVAGIIDGAAGPRPAGQPLSTGTYLALAALNRLVAPCSKAGFADWWKTTAATGSPRSPPWRWIIAGSGTRCTLSRWSSWSRHQPEDRSEDRAVRGRTCRRGAGHDQLRHVHRHGQRQGAHRSARKAKQKRSDLRLVGLGLAVTRDGGIPLTWRAYPGDRPDVTQFPAMIDQLEAGTRRCAPRPGWRWRRRT